MICGFTVFGENLIRAIFIYFESLYSVFRLLDDSHNSLVILFFIFRYKNSNTYV